MKISLQSAGLIHGNLFNVEGELVEHYNRALEHITGRRTTLESFHIDERGESPEIEGELGENYLQTSPAHRYMIVVSPSQRGTGLIHEEFSFDRDLFKLLYKNYSASIGVVTRVDGLYGEMDDGVRAYNSISDMLLVKNVRVALHTPSGFITSARELQKLVNQLGRDAELLTENDSEVPKRIFALVQEVGDVRGYNVDRISLNMDTPTFFTRLLDGIYVFRSAPQERRTVTLRRPRRTNPINMNNTTKINDKRFDYVRTIDNIYSSRPQPKEKFKSKKEAEHDDDNPSRTTVIYVDHDYQADELQSVDLIALDDIEEVLSFLISNKLACYDPQLIEGRLTRLEDATLLGCGYDAAELSQPTRQKAVDECKSRLPEEWSQMMKLKTDLGLGRSLDKVIKETPARVRSMILKPQDGNSKHGQNAAERYVITNLLTKLYTLDYENMFVSNTRDLEHIFENSSANIQKYIIQVLKSLKTQDGEA